VNRNEDGGQDEGEEPSDTALLRRITEGDQAAFAALYDRYNLLAYHLAHQLIGEHEGAEAEVLGVFLNLWRSRPGQGWCTRLAAHQPLSRETGSRYAPATPTRPTRRWACAHPPLKTRTKVLARSLL